MITLEEAHLADVKPSQAACDHWARGAEHLPGADEQLCLSASMLPLQSELANWVQWAAAADEWQTATLGVTVQ